METSISGSRKNPQNLPIISPRQNPGHSLGEVPPYNGIRSIKREGLQKQLFTLSRPSPIEGAANSEGFMKLYCRG
jgi:hypothetical protein